MGKKWFTVQAKNESIIVHQANPLPGEVSFPTLEEAFIDIRSEGIGDPKIRFSADIDTFESIKIRVMFIILLVKDFFNF